MENTVEPAIVPGNRNIVLSIDDDSHVISLYDRYLAPQGYQVIPLTDAGLALETAQKLKPLAITLDILMPRRDGWQVLSDLKKNPETAAIPVIICSILSERKKGISLGAVDYLVKPVLADDLIRVLAQLKAHHPKVNSFIKG
jgi:two-component system chemotaxis sensor kinase CheA